VQPIFAQLKRVLLGAAVVAALGLSLASPISAQTGPIAPDDGAARVDARSEAANVHVLLVADTDEVQYNAAGQIVGSIGPAVGQDVAAVQKLFEMFLAAQPELKGRIKITVLTGKNATPAQVRAYYRDLKCGPNDNLFFFLASHGGMRRGVESAEEAHILCVCSRLKADGCMTRSEVRRLMEGKQPRGIVLLTNVCSSYPEKREAPLHVDRSVVRSAPGLGPNAVTVRNLLFRAPRLVNITAAQDGTPAVAGHIGSAFGGASSAFTVALLHVLCDPDRNFATWEQLFPALAEETSKASGRLHRPRIFGLSEHRVGPAGPTPAPVREPETGPIGPDR
jgi:hypothetical protein